MQALVDKKSADVLVDGAVGPTVVRKPGVSVTWHFAGLAGLVLLAQGHIPSA